MTILWLPSIIRLGLAVILACVVYLMLLVVLKIGEVKILHGKGNGILKEEIRKYLKTVPGVVSCKDEDIQFGGSGITVVKMD